MKRSQFEDDIGSSAAEAEILEIDQNEEVEPRAKVHNRYLKEIDTIKRLDAEDREEALAAVLAGKRRKWWQR